ncbi:relaxase/mobilization nuclease domain-containing protein [Mucilaginibacter paludis]|uniref:Relaxase/mobilization nuclease family protein n=1 Tax=Mucilaginibacter paludis DSM 18603 TaxID=714943 RepID=H1Y3H5_9SPHI|nr:relaxase/mobilization nuclease domain-containing protein [Mucilaginibacter paludis]EHQ29743.1 Relaxase/mobilization nuclease family protein [Mucilaginibacter paludis DSM 18603]
MVVRIVSGKSIRGLLNYNERKVDAGQAELLMASRFGSELDDLGFNEKLNRFEHLTDLNSRVKTNALHIMLNFAPEENPADELLQQVAATYMERIGFGEQPYLVYRHHDAAHSHLHIVTTNIQPDGKRIAVHNLGRTLSEQTRKELEVELGLVKADGRQLKNILGIKAAEPEIAQYGRTPTKRAIANVVTAVTQSYRFTSLAELNAALQQFNVLADRGPEDSAMYERQGLVYSLLDKQGQRIGIPIKASALPYQPTLKNLEKLYAPNKQKREPKKAQLQKTIDQVFGKYHQLSKATFIKDLAKRQVSVVFRQNEQGFTYGVTFVDHRNKTVFNGSDLGKEYSAKASLEKLATYDHPKQPGQQHSFQPNDKQMPEALEPSTGQTESLTGQLIKDLLGRGAQDFMPIIPQQKRKKKKRKTL